MATIEKLAEVRAIIKVNVLKEAELEKRSIYVYPEVYRWMKSVLPTLTAFDEDDIRPYAQVWTLLKAFCAGDALEDGDEFRLMKPEENDVYELKSADVRFYGWFVQPGLFIVVKADTMERVHNHNLASGYRGEVERARDAIDLDPPKFIKGASKEDVFSI